MPLTHLLLALTVVFIWGTNFVVIKWGLADFPPFLFAALRFALCVLPWLLVFRRPPVRWSSLAAVGVLLGAGQFGFLYWAMQGSISPGMASLVIQSQVFFTILIAVVLNGERLRGLQYAALLLALGGYVLVGWHSIADPNASITLAGLFMVLAGGLSWGCANTVVRRVGRVNMAAFMVWSSLFSLITMGAITLLVDGPQRIADALVGAHWTAWAAALWQALGNTILGFGVWNWLLVRHPASQVTPMAMLVPVFGMVSSSLILQEAMPDWKIAAALMVLGGLALNIYAGRRGARA